MAHLTLAGLSEDGKRLLLVGDNGDEYTLDADNALRAALRGEHARIGQLEITMDSALRPRDIQARIRAGESAESVAQAAQTTVERIMPFAAPVLAERAHVAQRAQLSSVRRRSGETGARTLGEAAAAQLRGVGSTRPRSSGTPGGARTAGGPSSASSPPPSAPAPRRSPSTCRGNFVTVEDDHARWLVGEQVSQPERAEKEPTSRDDLQHARQRRLSSVPADELPLGDDAIEMVHDGDAPAEAATDTDDEAASDTETTMDLTEVAGLGAEQPVEAYLDEPGQKQSGTDEAGADKDAEAPTTTDEPEKPAAEEDERPARRPARKGRGRASVPSWDEIMFGGGKSD